MADLTVGCAKKRLMEAFPLPYKVRIARVALDPDEDGDSRVNKKKGTAFIRIRSTQSQKEQVETLVHEYAHLMAWDYYGDAESVVWGVAYSECYDAVYGGH